MCEPGMRWSTPLAGAGHRVLVPHLRGYGPTRFREAAAPRMAEQAAIGQDLIDFADALGPDTICRRRLRWGGRAAAIAAALLPHRVAAASSLAAIPFRMCFPRPDRRRPQTEAASWYQWDFNTERDAPGWPRIADRYVSCCGRCGRRPGTLPMRCSSERQSRSTTPTSSIA